LIVLKRKRIFEFSSSYNEKTRLVNNSLNVLMIIITRTTYLTERG